MDLVHEKEQNSRDFMRRARVRG